MYEHIVIYVLCLYPLLYFGINNVIHLFIHYEDYLLYPVADTLKTIMYTTFIWIGGIKFSERSTYIMISVTRGQVL